MQHAVRKIATITEVENEWPHGHCFGSRLEGKRLPLAEVVHLEAVLRRTFRKEFQVAQVKVGIDGDSTVLFVRVWRRSWTIKELNRAGRILGRMLVQKKIVDGYNTLLILDIKAHRPATTAAND